MHRVSHFILIDAEIGRVFDFVSDYRNLPRIQNQFQRLRPLSARTRGLGAQVEAKGSFHSFPITVKLEVVKFDPPNLVVTDSTGPVRSRTSWSFKEQPASGPNATARVRVALAVEYEVRIPGISLLGGLAQREVDTMTTTSLRRLKALLESGDGNQRIETR